MAAPRDVHLVVGDVVELVVHVAGGVDVDAGGDERDHHEHQHGEGIDVPADREPQPAPLVERVPVAAVVRPGLVPVRGGGVVVRMVAGVLPSAIGRGVGGARPLGMTGGAHRVVRQPRDEGHQRQGQRPDDRRRGDRRRPLAVVPETRAGEEDDDERRQRQEPGESQKGRQQRVDVHARSGPGLSP